MIRFTLASAIGFLAAPAFAHGGAHLHPHGFETAIAVGIVCAVAAAAVMLKSR